MFIVIVVVVLVTVVVVVLCIVYCVVVVLCIVYCGTGHCCGLFLSHFSDWLARGKTWCTLSDYRRCQTEKYQPVVRHRPSVTEVRQRHIRHCPTVTEVRHCTTTATVKLSVEYKYL